jgi:hypothetical protein
VSDLPKISAVKKKFTQNFGYSRLDQLPSRVILGLMPPRISGMIVHPNRRRVQFSI